MPDLEADPHRLLDLRVTAERLEAFAGDRNWEQFHTPKNLSMALAGEAGELLEIFQWLIPEESSGVRDNQALREHAAQELADIMILAIWMADILGIDLADAIERKISSNESRYPIDEVKGRAVKRD